MALIKSKTTVEIPHPKLRFTYEFGNIIMYSKNRCCIVSFFSKYCVSKSRSPCDVRDLPQ